jgi:hypothetical protein
MAWHGGGVVAVVVVELDAQSPLQAHEDMFSIGAAPHGLQVWFKAVHDGSELEL